jgi:membrane protein involved in colicin uptake
LHLAGDGAGEGKSSLSTAVVVDPGAATLALDRFAAAPVLLKVSR